MTRARRAVFALGVAGFVALSFAALRDAPHEWDERLLLALRDPNDLSRPAGPAWLATVWRDLTALGGATTVVLLSGLVCGYLALRRRWTRVLLILVTVAGGYAMSSGLKHAYGRERPALVPHLTEVSSPSFPSGHAMTSSLVYLTLGVLLAQAATRRREKLYCIAAAGGLVFLVGCSRVFLGVHYPSDVAAGWCAGTVWALACWRVARRYGRPAEGSAQGLAQSRVRATARDHSA